MTTRATVIVIGAGPAAIAATRRLREEAALRVCLVAPDGMAEYLPGTLAVATGDASVSRYRTSIELGRVEVIAGRAEALRPGAVKVDGSWLQAQAIIAAPGLALAPDAVGWGDRIVGFWDPSGAQAAAPRVQAVEHGVVQIVISSLPYRCPPAPYGLAMRIARRARRLGQPVKVRVVSPEAHPLAALGGDAGDFLLEACTQAGVEVRLGVHLDPEALREGRFDGPAAALADASLTIVIPSHRASPLLADLSAGKPLVAVDDRFASAVPGIFVVGDAAATAYPRAADPAAVSGVV
ncbi:MAG: NAD(P)/FAD-dependent oxidoreductase, partial [Acidimicrobiales bacterium]